MLNLLTIDFNGDAPASTKMGTEPIPIFELSPPQTLSGTGPLADRPFCSINVKVNPFDIACPNLKVSVVLYNLNSSREVIQPWYELLHWVMRQDEQPTSELMPVLPMCLLVPLLHLGVVEWVSESWRHAQHLRPGQCNSQKYTPWNYTPGMFWLRQYATVIDLFIHTFECHQFHNKLINAIDGCM